MKTAYIGRHAHLEQPISYLIFVLDFLFLGGWIGNFVKGLEGGQEQYNTISSGLRGLELLPSKKESLLWWKARI